VQSIHSLPQAIRTGDQLVRDSVLISRKINQKNAKHFPVLLGHGGIVDGNGDAAGHSGLQER